MSDILFLYKPIVYLNSNMYFDISKKNKFSRHNSLLFFVRDIYRASKL